MLVSDIKSRPVYPGLTVDDKARRHLVAAEGEGALAVLDAFAGDASALVRTTLLYSQRGSTPGDHSAKLAALRPETFHAMPSPADADHPPERLLATAAMGTRLYAAGTEGFIGSVVAAGVAHGVDHHSIVTEHRGSLARRVQCVHCKGLTENVTISPVVCAHCGLNLLVRDHFSRRLGAFQGVCIDAEAPGDAPSGRGALPVSGGVEIRVRVAEVEEATATVKRFRLAPVSGEPLAIYSAGAHVVVTMDAPDRKIKTPTR